MLASLRRALRARPRLPLLVVLALLATMPTVARAEHYDGFETHEPSWRDAGGDARYKLLRQLRIAQDAHSGRGCEFVEVESSDGATAIYLSYNLGNAPVIDELTASLYLRSDAPGIQLAARIVFPRTLEPNSQQPVTAMVLGASYDKPGQWQQLTIGDFRRQAEQQARVLRAQLRLPVDTRQAYVDRILLNVYVGPGTHRTWIDDLTVTGIVYKPSEPQLADAGPKPLPPMEGFLPISRTTGQPDAMPPVGPASVGAASVVELKGQTLLVRGKQFFPRIIEHQGEPLTFLQQLGFNTVRMRQTPSRETLEEAKKLGLWIVCPPPQPADLGNPYGAATPSSVAEFGEAFQSVLAWDLGEGLSARDLDVVKRWAEHVRRNDLPRPRPILCQAAGDLRSLSRQVDVVVTQRLPMGTSFELADYGNWLRDRTRLARPGTPQWAVIQTQPSRELARQAQLLSLARPAIPEVESEQIRLMVFEALAAGVRGLKFDSQTPLNATDDATRTRAAALHLINLELALIDPWAAAGSFVTRVPGSEADVSGALLQIDRGHLLLPMWTGARAQFVPGQSAGTGLTFVVPGVPEAVDVYEISPGGMRPLPRKRVAGGLRVTLDEFSLTTLVLLTQDPQVVSILSQQLGGIGPTASQLQLEVVQAKMRTAEYVHGELMGLAPPIANAATYLQQARTVLAAAETRFGAGNLRDGYLMTRRALRPLALLERAHWQTAVDAAGGSTSLTPFTSCFATLPEHWRMLGRLRGVSNWQNLVPGGEFENLDMTVQAGWRHFQHPQEALQSDADLAAAARTPAASQPGQSSTPQASSQFALRLRAHATTVDAAAAVTDSPPLWVVSPAVPVRAGDVVRISGWVNVPEDVAGGKERFLIFDSLGGENLAERFGKTAGWQRFTYHRMAPLDGEITLTAALGGAGSALLDDVTIEAGR